MKLDFIINIFNTAGQRIVNEKLLEAEYANGEKDTLKKNTEGQIRLIKRFYEQLNNKISITQIDPKFLGWETYLTTNKEKIEHINKTGIHKTP